MSCYFFFCCCHYICCIINLLWFLPFQEQKIEAKDYSRISNLPNDILSFIISLLSMKEAFRARLLSHKWRYLSPEITNLCFDSLIMFGENTDHELMRFGYHYPKALLDRSQEFVTNVAQRLRHLRVSKLNSLQVYFCLCKEYASYIDEWISLATAMSVEKIDLDLFYNPSERLNSIAFSVIFLILVIKLLTWNISALDHAF